MAAGDWDSYWRNARSAAAHKDGGPQDEVLERFWIPLFTQLFPEFQTGPKILDIACGNGSVARFALTALGNTDENAGAYFCGLDKLCSALEEMRHRNPGLGYVAANAALLPFQDETFDMVTSQFGVEYAGPEALAEAARVVAPGGMIAAVLHLRDGAIYRECAANLEAINGIRNSNLLHRFNALFKAALAVQQGQGGTQLFHEADKDFAAAVAATEEVLRRWGKGVADGVLFRLYTDMAHMYRRFKHYEPGEVFRWIGFMDNELNTFAGRMASMLKAALDPPALDQLLAQLTARNFTMRRRETLNMGRLSAPAAWVVVAEKTARNDPSRQPASRRE
jgi:SAM-dependent methyltransferase